MGVSDFVCCFMDQFYDCLGVLEGEKTCGGGRGGSEREYTPSTTISGGFLQTEAVGLLAMFMWSFRGTSVDGWYHNNVELHEEYKE